MTYLVEIQDGDFWCSSGYAFSRKQDAFAKAEELKKKGMATRVKETDTQEIVTE